MHHQVGVEPGSRLKRRSSERQKRSKGVQFEDQQAVATPWWNYPIKLMRGATNTNANEKSGTISSKRRRRRHYTDPESRNEDDNEDGHVRGVGGMLGWWVGWVGWGYNSSVLHFLGTKTKFHVTLFLKTDSTIC